MKKVLWLAIKISVAIGCFAWIFVKSKIPFTGEDGVLAILAESNKVILAAAVLPYLATTLMIARRWQLLLRVQGIEIPYLEAMRLTFLGHFFNNFMLGSVGGDVVKAYYAAKQTPRKAQAVITVFLDRVMGMFAMAIIAVVMMTFSPVVGELRKYDWYGYFHFLYVAIWIFIAASVALAPVFFSRRLRKLVRYEKILDAVPFKRLRNIVHDADQAFFLYRFHKRAILCAVLLSFVVHAVAVLVNYVLGLALGVRGLSFFDYYLFVPVALMIIAVPITPGGWGLRELIYQNFFEAVGVAGAIAISISALFRLTEMFWSLPGSYFWLVRRERVPLKEMEKEVAEEAELPFQGEGPGD